MGKSLCAFFKGRGKTGQQIVLPCKKPLKGSKVKIRLRGREYLSLAEVQVIAIKHISKFKKWFQGLYWEKKVENKNGETIFIMSGLIH